MKKMLCLAFLAVMFSGCVSYVEQPAVTPYEPQNNSGETPVAQITAHPYVEGATVRPLRVLVSIDGGKEGGDAYQFSSYVQSNLEGALAARGYRVVYEAPAEILLSTLGSVTCSVLNRRGTRLVYRGDADVQVTRAAFENKMRNETMKDVVARRRFDVKSAESRDREFGIKSLADTLNTDLSVWAAESVTRIAGALERCEFTIRNAWNYRGEEDYPSRFTATVNRMPGVYRCTVLSTDNVSRSIRAEVVYERDMFPEGFVNALYTVRSLNLYR
ncbi:MAG: hypothetical protein IJU44_04165 [Kiritimatiellae bacterium]|nr:hypothetical protein [Kiritimatiellia bacterium]